MNRRRSIASAMLALALCALPLCAQTQEGSLSEAEVEQVRDARYVPTDAILLFVKFLDERSDRISALYAKARRPGREQDTDDLMQQFTSICDELGDNLDDYGPRHVDLRKALPKVINASERWATALKSPPDDEAYAVSRKLALESIDDLRDTATHMQTEQEAWFKAHPVKKQSEQQQQNGEIDIPR